MGSKFPLHEPIVGRVWDSGLDYVRKTILETLVIVIGFILGVGIAIPYT